MTIGGLIAAARRWWAARRREPFGWHLSLDLHGCDHAAITSAETIAGFAAELCKRIEMTPYGPAAIEWFGEGADKTLGYSLAQLIETSLISGHFSAQRDSTHLDVFSCRLYDPDTAVAFAVECFGGRVARRRWAERP